MGLGHFYSKINVMAVEFVLYNLSFYILEVVNLFCMLDINELTNRCVHLIVLPDDGSVRSET